MASSAHSDASKRSAVFSISATRSVPAMPWKIADAASATAACSSVKVKSIRPPSPGDAGRNMGMVSSSSTATISTTTGMPMRTSPGSTPIRSATRRVPSSSSTTAMGRG